jgi:glutathione synthase/RimK-type ligase-like ATP-grasp enzyme
MAKKSGVFFRAVPDSGLATAIVTAQNKINLGFPNCFIPSPRIEQLLAEATETLWFPISRGTKLTLPKQAWFVNFCADPDEYARAMANLKRMAEMSGAPVFNHPDGVMNSRRDRVSEILQGIDGLTVPKCVRFSPKLPQDFQDEFERGGLSYPVLVRPAASQSGTHLVKVDGPDDWDRIFTIPWGGQVMHMTQFVDFANADGEYIKIRAVCAGDRVIIRHTLIATDWLVHAMDRTDAIVDREFQLHKQLYESPVFNAVVREAKQRIGLDFFGLDLGWRGQDDFVLFEANAAMSILSTAHMPTYRRPEYAKILKDIEEAVVRAIRAVQFRAAKGR